MVTVVVFKRSLLKATLIGYSLFLFWQLFLGPYRFDTQDTSYNFTLLKTIKMYILYADLFTWKMIFINLFGNVGAFVPIGFLLAYFYRPWRSVILQQLMFLPIIFLVETAQYAFRVGGFDVDDILLNSIGMLIGWLIYKMRRAGLL